MLIIFFGLKQIIHILCYLTSTSWSLSFFSQCVFADVWHISLEILEKIRICHLGHSMEPVTTVTTFLSTWRSPWRPMIFAPMVAISRMDKGYHNLSKTISFRLFFRLTIAWNDPFLCRICHFLNTKSNREIERWLLNSSNLLCFWICSVRISRGLLYNTFLTK